MNVLILHADQHRFDCIGAYGNADVKTSNIDALARDGVKYLNHFTVYPICTPSRYSFFSGMYVHQHGAWSNEATLPDGYAAFPKALKAKGYHTAAVGKMHFTPTYQNIGFEKMILAEQNGDGRFEDDYHSYLKDNGLIDAVDLTDQVDAVRRSADKKYYDHFGAFKSDLPLKHHSTSWITSQAVAEIEKWTPRQNNLLFVGYIKPHHPFDPPAPYSNMYDPSSLALPYGYTDDVPEHDYKNNHGFFDNKTLTEPKLREILAKYYGAITQIDDGVGEIISELKSKGMYDDTMIIYTSDHGEYMGFHHMLLKCNFLYEPLARIPLIIKYPKAEEARGINERLSENIDVAPTILKLCKIPVPHSMSGINLLTDGREYAFSEGQYGSDAEPKNGYMARSKRYKLIVNGSFGDSMFFDLENDKNELVNLINNPDYSEEIEKHKAFLTEKMLFSATGKAHCSRAAETVVPKAETELRKKELKKFIFEKLNTEV